MRFTYAEAMTDPTYYIPLAKAAEAAGYHAMTIPDSVAYPFESDSKYPYTPDGNREFLDGKSFIEAFVLASALCAVTTTLKFNFFVLKLPIRPPALVAKQVGALERALEVFVEGNERLRDAELNRIDLPGVATTTDDDSNVVLVIFNDGKWAL